MTSSSRPWPTHATSPLPQSCSPRTLIRRSTRSRMAWASRAVSLVVVNDVHSGFWPTPSVFRYEIRYLGMATSASLPCHELGEPVEQVVGVVRAGRRLRMVLHGERRPLAVGKPLARAVVEVDVRGLPAVAGDRLGLDREPVVLGGDLGLVRDQVLHRMVCAVVAELELVCAAAAGQPHDLVTPADPDDREPTKEPADRLDQVGHALRIARAVRE